MAVEEYPTMQDLAPSWADIEITCLPYDGVAVSTKDIAALKWSQTVEVGEVRGTGGRVRKRTRGQLSLEASITMYKQGWAALRAALSAVASTKGVGMSLVAFDIVAKHTTPALAGDEEIHVVEIKGCRVLGLSSDMAEGVDADQVEVTLNPMIIMEDGVPLL